MSDLINRKVVMDWLRDLQAQSIINRHNGTLVDATIESSVNGFINFIVQVPTVYDVDKVVEILDKDAQMLYSMGNFSPVKAWENKYLIPVIKAGGNLSFKDIVEGGR